jgi:hypothetical protein
MKLTLNLTKDELYAVQVALNVELRRLPQNSMDHKHLKAALKKLEAANDVAASQEK